MEKSFSIQFNDIDGLKTIKEYEGEIKELRNENFALKQEIACYKNPANGINPDIYRLLEDSKRSIEILERDKKNLMDEFQLATLDLQNENQRLLKCIEGLNVQNQNLELENRRLTGSIRSMDDNVKGIESERNQMKAKVLRIEKELLKVSDERMVLEKRLFEFEKSYAEQEKNIKAKCNLGYNNLVGKYEGLEREFLDLQKKCRSLECSNCAKDAEMANVVNERDVLREQLKLKEQECVRTRQEKEGEIRELNSRCKDTDSYIRRIKDETERTIGLLKEQLSEEQKTKELLERNCRSMEASIKDTKRSIERAKMDYDSLRGSYNDVVVDRDNLRETVHELKKRYVERLMKAVERVSGQEGMLDNLNRRIPPMLYAMEKILKSGVELKRALNATSDENKLSEASLMFIEKIGISNPKDINVIISEFSRVYGKLNDKVELLEKQVSDITRFANNNKKLVNDRTMKLVSEFSKELKAIKTELDECERYLIKKNSEVKEIKKEKAVTDKKLDCTRKEMSSKIAALKKLYIDAKNDVKEKSRTISILKMRANMRA